MRVMAAGPLQPENLVDADEAGLAVAMTHLDPARLGGSGGRGRAFGEFEQHILLGTKYHGSRVLGPGANVGTGGAHEQYRAAR